MNRYTLRTLLRSIRQSLGRYLAILAIVALGVGFFAGLKSSCPAMLGTADAYFHRQRFEDFRLLSSLGLTEEDAAAFEALPGVARSFRSTAVTVPLLTRMTRSAMAHRALLWVMMMTVMPRRRLVSCSSFRIALPV